MRVTVRKLLSHNYREERLDAACAARSSISAHENIRDLWYLPKRARFRRTMNRVFYIFTSRDREAIDESHMYPLNKDASYSISFSYSMAQSIKIMFAIAIFITYALQAYVPVEILWTTYLNHRVRTCKLFWEYVCRTIVTLVTCEYRSISADINREILFHYLNLIESIETSVTSSRTIFGV